jgi:hypothetical protein
MVRAMRVRIEQALTEYRGGDFDSLTRPGAAL